MRLPGQVGHPRLPGPITKDEFKDRVEVAKESAADVALKAIQHLDERFPDDEFAKATKILEPSYYKSDNGQGLVCLLYTSPSPRDLSTSRMPSSA